MIKIYQDNGLPFYAEDWIRDRRYAEDVIRWAIVTALSSVNKAWQYRQIEAPCLIPIELVSKEYSEDDIYTLANDDYYLKPETTASSYAYAAHLNDSQVFQPPFCVWQTSKSFRRENDQVTKNVRLKEFYQQEFQCIVTSDTKKDYQDGDIVEQLCETVRQLTGLKCRIVPSDRLPSYSDKTIDIEVKTSHKWLEVCSISKRHDVPFDWEVNAPESGKPRFTKSLVNYEFAFGLDRIVYAMHEKSPKI